MNRPKCAGHYITTPKAERLFRLLGTGVRSGTVTLTRDETEALSRLYEFELEKPTKKPPKPKLKPVEIKPGMDSYAIRRAEEQAEEDHQKAIELWESWTDPMPLMQAGADRNMVRHAEHDGMRLVAWIAKYVEPGQDPLKTLVQLAIDAGYDVDPSDITWAES